MSIWYAGKKKSEEYKNMKLRCEVLEVGKEELLSKIDEIKKQQRGEEKRIDNINREQDRIRKDIEEMQKRCIQKYIDIEKYRRNAEEVRSKIYGYKKI